MPAKKMEEQEKYIEIVSQIEDNYIIMKNMRPLNPSAIKRYNEEFSISASYNSNAIEGNTFTYDETNLLLKEGVTSSARSFREHEEIVGYKSGFDFLYAALKEGKIIDENLIKQVHQYVFRGQPKAGEYREEQVFIGDIFNITFTPCSANAVPGQMAKYISQLQADMAENIKLKEKTSNFDWHGVFHNLAKHHIEFERIHPFIDGNGRTGRLLLTYEMISMGLLPVDIRYEERVRYYAAFKEYESKAKYSTRPESKTENMAKLLAESELRSMTVWNRMFSNFISDGSVGSSTAPESGKKNNDFEM